MLKSLLVFLGLALVSFTGQAVAAVGATTTFCSGIQTSSSIVGSPFTLSCAGDLSLSGGTLSDSLGIFLSSTGAMTLDNITITAPTIQFNAGTAFAITQSVALAGTNISFVAGTVNLAVGANINITPGGTLLVGGGGNVIPGGSTVISPVPEPSTYILLLMGFICLIGFQRIVSSREEHSILKVQSLFGFI
jgi:hypothetical protein